MNTISITMIKGDSLDIPFAFQKNGVAEPLTSYAISFNCKRVWDDVSYVFHKTINNGITITDMAGGLFTASILPADTTDVVISSNEVTLVVNVSLTIGSLVAHTTNGTMTVKKTILES